MPQVYYHDKSSGIDIEDTIKKLLEVEREPIRRYEREIKKSRLKIKAWEQMQVEVAKLVRAAEKLNSFRSPFGQSSLVSSQKGAVSGIVKKGTKAGRRELEVLQLAQAHKVASDLLLHNTAIPAGSFSITMNGKETKVQFPGGSLQALADFLKKNVTAAAAVTVSRSGSGNNKRLRIQLESRRAGLDGRMAFQDPNGVLAKAGFLFQSKAETEVDELLFTENGLSSYKPEMLFAGTSDWQILAGGEKLRLAGPIGKRFRSVRSQMPDGSTLIVEWFAKKDAEPKRDTPTAPSGGKKFDALPAGAGTRQIGPDTQININGITLDGYKVDRSSTQKQMPGSESKPGDNKKAEPEQPPGPDNNPYSFKLHYADRSEDESTAVGIYDSMQNPSGVFKKAGSPWGDAECKMTPFNQNGGRIECKFVTAGKMVSIPEIVLEVNGAKEVWVSRPILKAPKLGGKFQPKNVVAEAQDAEFKLDGVKMSRTRNSKLDDVIDGVSLSLHKKTVGPSIITIESKQEDATTSLKEFVEAYNNVRRLGRELGKTARSLGLADLNKRKQNSGILAGDSTVRRLLNTMQDVVIKAYPSNTQPQYKVMAQVGISTGAPGSKWAEIKAGYLVIDEAKLTEALQNPMAVRELFSSDTNGDGRIDDGVAYQTIKKMKPYTRSTGGMITIRIQSLRDRIDDKNDRIAAKEQYLKKFEITTRQKFERMEKALLRSKNQREYLKNNNPNRK